MDCARAYVLFPDPELPKTMILMLPNYQLGGGNVVMKRKRALGYLRLRTTAKSTN